MPLIKSIPARLKKLSQEGFTAMDVAEPLVSFDAEKQAREVKDLMLLTGKTMEASLLEKSGYKKSKQRLDDYIILTSQLAIDEFEDTYEILKTYPPEQVAAIDTVESVSSSDDLKRIVIQLEDICSDSLSHHLSGIF